MNFDELCERARHAAATGADWDRVIFRDDINDAYCELSRSGDLDKDKLELAFVEGRREFRKTTGWIVAWTSARADYDQFDTEELECVDWNGRVLRRVLISPGNAVFQRSRYMSGAFVWDEDPRETERRIRETIARDRADDDAKRIVREQGLSWLRSAELDLRTDEDLFDNELRSRGLSWNDLRAEQKRREDEAATKERAAEWNRCRSMFADGCTIVDRGRDAVRGTYGVIAGTDCAVYRNVRVVPHWSEKDSVGDAMVEDERHTNVGSLWLVADRLTKGEYRIAGVDEVLPPALVLDRVKPTRLTDVLRVETEGRVVWAVREKYSYSEILVMDERGHLVRKKSIKEAATIALRTKEDARWL